MSKNQFLACMEGREIIVDEESSIFDSFRSDKESQDKEE